jgi:tetratricopeptide (TPR) repeat protein
MIRIIKLNRLLAIFLALSVGTAAMAQLLYPSKAYWSDPENINAFLGTYGILGTVEPKISQEEGVVLKELILILKGRDKKLAIATLLSAITPESSAALDFTLANLYFETGEFDNAIGYYRTALQKAPNFLRAHKNLGIILVQKGKFDDAIGPLTKAINLGNPDGITYGLIGLCFLNSSDPLSAESAYRNALIFSPKTRDWKLGLARSLLEQRKFNATISLLEFLIAAKPEDSSLWLVQANAYLGNEDPMKAAANYEIVSRLGKATGDSLNLLGDIYMNEDMKDLALNAYLGAMEKNPDQDISRPISATEILTNRGALIEAQLIINRIRESYFDISNKNDLRLLKLQARNDIGMGRREDAIDVLERIVKREPLDGEALILLARFYSQSEDDKMIEQAVLRYERAAKIADYEARAKLAHAQMLVGVANYKDAVPLLEDVMDIDPSPSKLRYLQAVRNARDAL